MLDTQLFETIRIRPACGVSRHQQLYEGIKRVIDTSDATPGMQLPPQSDIARSCGVSLSTAVHAIRLLCRDGLVTTRHGTGTFVAEKSPQAVDVVISSGSPSKDTPLFHLFKHLLEGLTDGFGDNPSRLAVHYLPDAHSGTAQEVADIARARHAAVVIYEFQRAQPPLASQLAGLAPTVAVFNTDEHCAVDRIQQDISGPLRKALEARIAAGARTFALVQPEDAPRMSPLNPYVMMRDVFAATLNDAGMPADILVSPRPHVPGSGFMDADRAVIERIRALPPSPVIVAVYPELAEDCVRLRPDADVITYTEFQETLDRTRSSISVLYASIAAGARAAVPLLQTVASRGLGRPRTVRLEAEFVERGN